MILTNIPAKSYPQAVQWVKHNQNLKAEKDFIRFVRESEYKNILGSNCGMVLDFILRVMMSSDNAMYSMSRDSASLETGIPETTIEYNVKKLIRLGIFNETKFPSRKNRNNCQRILTINLAFRRKLKKIFSELDCPNIVNNPKQELDDAFVAQSSSAFFLASSFVRAVSLFRGFCGMKLCVYPTELKKLSLFKYNTRYKSLKILQKINYLKNHIEEDGGGWAIRIPKGYMMIDCDSKESFERMLMEYYCGGFIVKSPRGGKILVKIKESDIIPENEKDLEYLKSGRFAVVAGQGYEFMSMNGIGNFKPESNLTRVGTIKKARQEYQFDGKVTVGMRNDYLFRFGRRLKCQGYKFEALWGNLLEENRKFAIPLDLSEVKYLAKHCLNYKNVRGFHAN